MTSSQYFGHVHSTARNGERVGEDGERRVVGERGRDQGGLEGDLEFYQFLVE